MRRTYGSQRSINSGTPGTPSSPLISPYHPLNGRGGSSAMSGVKRAQAKAATQRLAQVMSHQPPCKDVSDDEDDDDDDISYDYNAGSIGLAGGRKLQPRSPLTIPGSQNVSQTKPSNRHARDCFNDDKKPLKATKPYYLVDDATEDDGNDELMDDSRLGVPSRISIEAGGAKSNAIRSPSSGVREQPLSARSVAVPQQRPLKMPLKPVSPLQSRRDKRLSLDLGSIKIKESSDHSNSALQDEIDVLQEENEHLIEKLRIAEEKSQEADARAKQLAQQISALGEGVTMEARLLSRKEAALQQREAALRYAEQTNKPEKILALKAEFEAVKDEATSALEQLQEAEDEIITLRKILGRLILTQEDMEEMVMKRCWLARYWKLCVEHGVLVEMAEVKLEYWSSFAPLPNEVVLATAKQIISENVSDNCDEDDRKTLRGIDELSGDGNIESMLLVERGLRELASFKIEDSIAVAMARKRRSNMLGSDEIKLPTAGQVDAFELSQEESEDVHFKQAWLVYFWKRASNHGIQSDVAEERLQFWINHSARHATSHDAVDVQRGLMELRKLGIENLLWQHSRRGFDTKISAKAHLESNY